jgi:hypothetical protein
MVRNPKRLEQAELKDEWQQPLGVSEKFALFEEMYKYAHSMGGLHAGKAKDDLGDVIALAKKIHGNVPTPSGARR